MCNYTFLGNTCLCTTDRLITFLFLFFREELLHSLLPIRGVFPSLLKCLYKESPLPLSTTQEIENNSSTPPPSPPTTANHLGSNSVFDTQTSLTYCPLCRQPSLEIKGPTPEQFAPENSEAICVDSE